MNASSKMMIENKFSRLNQIQSMVRNQLDNVIINVKLFLIKFQSNIFILAI